MATKKKDSRLSRAGVSGYNKPKRTPNHPKKSHIVVAKEGNKIKTIRYGQQGAKTAGKPKAGESDRMKKKRKSFKARHAKNIAKGKMSAAYWPNRRKWKKEKIQTKNNSEFVGQVKDRGTFDLTLTFRKGFESDFGVSFLNTLKDAQGNVFTYWGNSFLDVEVDSKITVKATIKDHREYQGTKQTVIDRPKIIEGVR